MQCALGGFIAASNAKELPGESCARGSAGSPRPLVSIPMCPRYLRSRLISRRKRFACSIATNSRLPARRFFRSSAVTMRSACASASIKTRPDGCAWIPDAAAPWNGSLPQPNHAARRASVAVGATVAARVVLRIAGFLRRALRVSAVAQRVKEIARVAGRIRAFHRTRRMVTIAPGVAGALIGASVVAVVVVVGIVRQHGSRAEAHETDGGEEDQRKARTGCFHTRSQTPRASGYSKFPHRRVCAQPCVCGWSWRWGWECTRSP